MTAYYPVHGTAAPGFERLRDIFERAVR